MPAKRGREDRGEEDVAVDRSLLAILGCRLPACPPGGTGPLRHSAVFVDHTVAGLHDDRSDVISIGLRRVEMHRRTPTDQVDRHVVNAWYGADGPLDAANTRRAGHPFDDQIGVLPGICIVHGRSPARTTHGRTVHYTWIGDDDARARPRGTR
jgi:hypothetical protein